MASEIPRLPPYRHSLAGTLLAAREAVMASIRPTLRDAGVTEQQWRVLRVLTDEGTMDATSLAAAAFLHPPSVSRILRDLSRRKLIERLRDENDARRLIITITRQGSVLLASTAATTSKTLNRYRKDFGADRLAALVTELTELKAIVERGSTPAD